MCVPVATVMAAAAPAKLAGQIRGLPPVLAPERLRSLIAAGRAFTVGPDTQFWLRSGAGKATVAVDFAAHHMLDRGRPLPGAGRRLLPAPTIT